MMYDHDSSSSFDEEVEMQMEEQQEVVYRAPNLSGKWQQFKAPTLAKSVSKVDPSCDFNVVYFDLETTGLESGSDQIVQIAALCENNETFETFVNPTVGTIDPGASAVHKITKRDGKLYFEGREVAAVGIAEAIDGLMAFLETKGSVLLVCHNAKFDAGFMYEALDKLALKQEFNEYVVGFACTLEAARQKLGQQTRKRLEDLHLFFTKRPAVNLHTATGDVLALKTVTEHLLPSASDLCEFSYSMEAYFGYKDGIKGAFGLRSLFRVKGVTSNTLYELGKAGFNEIEFRDILDGAASVGDFIREVQKRAPKLRRKQVLEEIFLYFVQERQQNRE